MILLRRKQQKPGPSGQPDYYLAGRMLIAMPGMPDQRFEQSVIFVCQHNETGAMGLLVNKPVASLSFQDLLQQLSIRTNGRPKLSLPVQFGGPNDTERGFVLHSPDYPSGDSTTWTAGGLHLTMTVDVLKAIAEGRGPSQAMVALGYAGWSAGHLERELHSHTWLICDPDPFLVFGAEFGAKWTHAIRKLGFDPSQLSQYGGRA